MRKQDEYMAAVDDIEKGTPFIRVIPTLWVWGENDKLVAESIVRARRIWESKGYVMQEDRGILTILLISSVPFGLYLQGKNLDNLDRDFIAPAASVAPLLPIQGDFAGGGAAQMLFIGRKGSRVRSTFSARRASTTTTCSSRRAQERANPSSSTAWLSTITRAEQ